MKATRSSKRKSSLVQIDLNNNDVKPSEGIVDNKKSIKSYNLRSKTEKSSHNALDDNSTKKAKKNIKIKKELIDKENSSFDNLDITLNGKQYQYKKESVIKTESKNGTEHQVKNEIKSEIESDNEDEFENEDDYEARIRKNLEEKKKLLEQLNIFEAKNELQKYAKPVVSKKRMYLKREPVPDNCRRRSLRIQNSTYDFGDDTSPKAVLEKKYGSNNPMVKEFVEKESYVRPPPGPAPLIDYLPATGEKENCEEFIKKLSKLSYSEKTSTDNSKWTGSINDLQSKLGKLKIGEEEDCRCLLTRPFCMTFHWSADPGIVLVGGKKGELGIVNIDRKEITNHYFKVHSAPIIDLQVDQWNENKVYSCGYDSSFRITDLETSILEQYYDAVDETIYSISQYNPNNLLLSSKAIVINLDIRDRNNSTNMRCHEKYVIRSVASHPKERNYFCTSSYDGQVRLWDLRNFKKNKPISEVMHTKMVTSLSFSNNGKVLLTCCNDSYLAVLDWSSSGLTKRTHIVHNTETGRWLTRFRPVFFPGRDDAFIVGSIGHPRKLMAYSTSGSVIKLINNLPYVFSIVAMHPQRDEIVTSNSSGKMFILK